MRWVWVVSALFCLGVCHGADNDSLRGALEAINRRQRDLQDPTLYYVEHFRPSKEREGPGPGPGRVMLPQHDDDDGQPEDIGYGYQKSFSPNTAGVFGAFPISEGELESHDSGVESYSPSNGKALENTILDYIADNIKNSEAVKDRQYLYQNSNKKRSVFRERDVKISPDILQNLYSGEGDVDRFFENGEHPQVIPSSFRQRVSTKPLRHNPSTNVQSLIRNFGGLNRDTDNMPENTDDSDEYLSMLNSVWEKYQDSNPDHFDPEDLSESNVEEILSYINHKDEKKRQHDGSYDNGFDFYNSPLAWVKRDTKTFSENTKPTGDQVLRKLKFLNSHTDALDPSQEDYVAGDEMDTDAVELLMDEQPLKNKNRYSKRYWRGNPYGGYDIAKRYPVAKRSSSYYTSPAVLYHKHSAVDKFIQRRKKNIKAHISDDVTDPKIAQELNHIFSSTENLNKKNDHNQSENLSQLLSSHPKNNTKNSSTVVKNNSSLNMDKVTSNYNHGSHSHMKRSGQKEETGVDSQQKPLEVSKKSVDWSDYFGIDKRHKKSTNKAGSDEWLLDQYLKAYSISARAIKDSSTNTKTRNPHFEIDKKSSDDMDAKLRAMEDMIVDQALKYTGAHEGMTNSEEVQAVKDNVIAQLAAAYSLEKMRKALSEFKSSMAAQKVSTNSHTTTNSPTELPEQKDKRVAVKKEKAGLTSDAKLEKKEDSDNHISVLHPLGHSHSNSWSQEGSCSIMEDIIQRCKEIANVAGDRSEVLVPLCNLHQVCYLCSAEMELAASDCDLTFLREGNRLCGDSPRCQYTVHRTMTSMHSSLRGGPSSLGCEWQNHPCLARYLAITMR